MPIRRPMTARRGPRPGVFVFACAAVIMASWTVPTRIHADDSEDVQIALSLAKLLEAGRSVISSNQDLINDPDRDTENNLLLIRGAIPGPNGGYVVIRETNAVKPKGKQPDKKKK